MGRTACGADCSVKQICLPWLCKAHRIGNIKRALDLISWHNYFNLELQTDMIKNRKGWRQKNGSNIVHTYWGLKSEKRMNRSELLQETSLRLLLLPPQWWTQVLHILCNCPPWFQCPRHIWSFGKHPNNYECDKGMVADHINKTHFQQLKGLLQISVSISDENGV